MQLWSPLCVSLRLQMIGFCNAISPHPLHNAPNNNNPHTHTHTHTHTENHKQEQSKKRGERKLLRSCRAAVDVFRSVDTERQNEVLDSGFSSDTDFMMCPHLLHALGCSNQQTKKNPLEEFVFMTAQNKLHPVSGATTQPYTHANREGLRGGARNKCMSAHQAGPHTHTHTHTNTHAHTHTHTHN